MAGCGDRAMSFCWSAELMYFLNAYILVLGSFKVTIIYTIIHSIIFLININGVVKEFNNGVINGDFLINGLQGLLLH